MKKDLKRQLFPIAILFSLSMALTLSSCSSKPLVPIQTEKTITVQQPLIVAFPGIWYLEKSYWVITDSKQKTIPAEYDSIFNQSVINTLEGQPELSAFICNPCDKPHDIKLTINFDQYGLNDQGTIFEGMVVIKDKFGATLIKAPFEYLEALRPTINANTNIAIRKVLELTLESIDKIDFSFMDRSDALLAYKEKDYETLAEIVSKGISLEPIDEQRSSLLHYIANDRDSVALELVKQLEGINVDHPTKEGITPLMVAAQQRNEQMVSWLLQIGADPTIRNKNGTQALHYAGSTIKNDLTNCFMRGYRGNFFSDMEYNEHAKYDPEILGFRDYIYIDANIIQLLVNAGADLDSEDKDGYTLKESLETWFEDSDVYESLLDRIKG